MANTTPDLARCCLTCHATAATDGGSLKACGGCLKAKYCSTAGQKAGRKDHKVWCQAIRVRHHGEAAPTPSTFFAARDAFNLASKTARDLAVIAALGIETSEPRHLTHIFVLSYEPNSAWKLGDPASARFKPIAGSAQTEAEVLQHLRWAGERDPELAIRWMRGQEPGQEQEPGRWPGARWMCAPVFILYKTSEHPDAEWEFSRRPSYVSMAMLDPQQSYQSHESTEGWLERLATDLTSGGGGNVVAQAGKSTLYHFT